MAVPLDPAAADLQALANIVPPPAPIPPVAPAPLAAPVPPAAPVPAVADQALPAPPAPNAHPAEAVAGQPDQLNEVFFSLQCICFSP